VKRIAIGAILATVVAMVVKRLPLRELRRRVNPKLEDLTKDELYQRAQEADIQGRGHMSKDDLINALKEA
jgi:Rho termination factor, N-terminal domain